MKETTKETLIDYFEKSMKKLIDVVPLIMFAGAASIGIAIYSLVEKSRNREYEQDKSYYQETMEREERLYKQISDIKIKAAGPDRNLDLEERIIMVRDLGYVDLIDKDLPIELEVIHRNYGGPVIPYLKITTDNNTYRVPTEKIEEQLQE